MDENKDLINKTPATVEFEEEDKEYLDLVDKFQEKDKTVNKNLKKKVNKLTGLIIGFIVAVILVATILIILFAPNGTEEEEIDLTAVAEINSAVNEDDVWQANVKTDDNGNIKENGSGTLMEYIPSEIKKIKVSNTYGNFTLTSYTPVNEDGETESTEYTLVGFEEFEMQGGTPDDVANDCASLAFNKVIDIDATDHLSDYGLEKPRSVTTVYYTDSTKSVIKVGNDAPQGVGTYVSFGDSNTVYIVELDAVDSLLFDVTDLISLTINDSADTTENSDFNYVTLSGSAFSKNITLKLNDDKDNITNSYMLTAPTKVYADNNEASLVSGGIRGLYATDVVCVNPNANQLSKYGLSSQYAHLVAQYPDTTVNLIASKPNSNGNCYLMKNGGNIVYKIASSSIPWVTTSYDKLVSTYILSPSLTGLSSLTVDTGSDKYLFDLNTETVDTTDDDGNTTSSTTTVVRYDGDELTLGYFETYFYNLTLITKADLNSGKTSQKADLTITYSYEKGRSNDVIKFYKDANNKYSVTLNSTPVGHVYSSFVKKLIEQAPKIAKDKSVASFW